MSTQTTPRTAQGLLIKSPAYRAGYTLIAGPGNSPLKWLTFGRLVLAAGQREESSTASSELVLSVFTGLCQVTVKGAAGTVSFQVGGRSDAFSASPSMVYIPAGHDYTVECPAGKAVVALFSAPAPQNGYCPALVTAEQTMVKEVGCDNWSRRVMTSIGDNVAAHRLIVGETLNPPGNWSSAPPHKHDRHRPPQEGVMEEIYYFQVKPSQGFGFMRVYTAPDDPDPFDEAYVVEDGDTVLIPRGYHPVVAAPGYQLHYTWALAGEERRYGAWSDDPKHAWIKG